ncbi:uncharacterized protein MICPUCDRAFT_68752 [Micromonas pusilla CCMP1545]|uniref:Predicted protein n=2 Tax=Micromonas pusilla TaxID=38833 RepID=C1N3V7_MICPC|nr:uncharacterized protein MICPUCDRAFT_68752 [Micromonas pusilla CCMP1545]EEH53502.1 predicted protein [Micromonas pusilla CCMP1545]|eukprot:XP_003062683.1 predicted protein [Micromonas pusilla CCMP1545]
MAAAASAPAVTLSSRWHARPRPRDAPHRARAPLRPTRATAPRPSRLVVRSSATRGGGATTTPSPAAALLPAAPMTQLAAAIATTPAKSSPWLSTFLPGGTGFAVAASLFAASALAVLTACVAGFLVAIREMVRACREATIASRAVSECAQSINVACAALQVTLTTADDVLDGVAGATKSTASVIESATREVGVLQRRLTDLPNTASRTLMEAITRQYDGDAKASGGKEGGKGVQGNARAGETRIEIGKVIAGERAGARWVNGAPGCGFTFSRGNKFRVGEYCAVPRTDNSYTWGVIELNDLDYSAELSEDGEGMNCEWPPPYPDRCELPSADERDIMASQDAAGNTGIGAWFDDAIVSALGAEKADKVEGFLRVATGLTPIEESEYKVVVELDNYAYSFKIMNAGDLGKRILP